MSQWSLVYVLVLLLCLSALPAHNNKASVHQDNNLNSGCERPGGEAAPLTCSPDPCAAVDHHWGAQWVAGPLGAQGLHHLPLLSLHGSQEVDESHRRGGDAIVWPAEVLQVTDLSLFTGLKRWRRRRKKRSRRMRATSWC